MREGEDPPVRQHGADGPTRVGRPQQSSVFVGELGLLISRQRGENRAQRRPAHPAENRVVPGKTWKYVVSQT